jgi:uncharacterized protein (TIGR00251 family)
MVTPSAPSSRDWPCLHVTRSGTVLDLHVAPNAKRTQCMGLHGAALRIRLAAPPVDGAANEALQRWLADELGVARQAVGLVRGDSSRLKQVSLALPAEQVAQWLARVVPD